MPNKSKYGLSRNIPKEVSLEIRKRSGFGCVICGSGFYNYEHFDPEFYEAREHNPNGMTLLCPNCHTRKTKGMLSREAVKRGMDNPFCLQKGFSSGFFDSPTQTPKFEFGNNEFSGVNIPVAILGKPILSIAKPEAEGDFFKISGIFYDSSGKPSLEIDNNEWKVYSGVWDFEQVANRLTIRENKSKVCLELISFPPNLIKIKSLDLQYMNHTIKVINDMLIVDGLKLNGSSFSDGEFAFYLT